MPNIKLILMAFALLGISVGMIAKGDLLAEEEKIISEPQGEPSISPPVDTPEQALEKLSQRLSSGKAPDLLPEKDDHSTDFNEQTTRPDVIDITTKRPSSLGDPELDNLYQATQNKADKTVFSVTTSRYLNLQRELELIQREREEKSSLEEAKREIDDRMQEMDKKVTEAQRLKDELNSTITRKIDSNENLRQLVSLYESMPAENVVKIIRQLPLTTSINIIRMMSPKKSSKLLSTMEANMAAEFSRRLIKKPEGKIVATTTGGNS